MVEPWRSLAEELVAAPECDRDAVLERFLSGRSGRDEIIRAIADADPDRTPLPRNLAHRPTPGRRCASTSCPLLSPFRPTSFRPWLLN